MAWPQGSPPPQPPPQPPPPPPGGGGGLGTGSKPLPLGGVVAGAAGVLTFLFSFVQIAKPDGDFGGDGWSVWTTNLGLFGVGTWIPLFALVAGLIGLARGFSPELEGKQVLGFGPLQVQIAALAFAVLLWLGYVVNILLSDFVAFGLGAFLLLVGLIGVAAGTGLSLTNADAGPTAPRVDPATHHWPPPPPEQSWQQPGGHVPGAPGAAPVPGQGVPGQGVPGQAAPGQWQPDPGAVPPPPPGQAPGQPTPPPGGGPGPFPAPPPGQAPPPPQPGGGALIDPGTQVIPGPPPAPPPDDVNPPPPPGGYPPPPPRP